MIKILNILYNDVVIYNYMKKYGEICRDNLYWGQAFNDEG